MKGTSAVMDEIDVEVEKPRKGGARLTGYVHLWDPKGLYGFIVVNGVNDKGQLKQWHFHASYLRPGHSVQSIGMGTAVTFTPVPTRDANKRDKATEIEVVG